MSLHHLEGQVVGGKLTQLTQDYSSWWQEMHGFFEGGYILLSTLRYY